MYKINKRVGLALLFASLGMGVSACGTDKLQPEVQEPDVAGTIELQLRTTGTSGATYRLRDAVMVIQGPSSTLFFNSEDDPDAPMISARVPVGDYSIFLQDGWYMEQSGAYDAGSSVVDAVQTSSNPEFFTVYSGALTNVPLRFSVGSDVSSQGSFGVTLEVDESHVVSANCSTDTDCSAGETCCLAGFLGNCISLQPGQACPLPDLTVSASAAMSSLVMDEEYFAPDSCAMEEGCVDAAGTRRLLRFATQTPNIGEADMVLGTPGVDHGFEYSSCHGHYHFEGYAQYELLDSQGQVAATGHKQAFCLLDSDPVGIPGAPTSPRYHCGFQGIQRGWSDTYGAYLDCQWVDITTVAPGDYSLRITINPNQELPESDYTNNSVEVPVTITDPALTDPTAACPPNSYGTGRECGWTVEPGYGDVACTPGEALNVGCGCSCTGDTIVRICDGAAPCTDGHAIAVSDDVCGYCSDTVFTCPASGHYGVMTGSYSSGYPYVCPLTGSIGNPPPQTDAGGSVDGG